MGVSVSAPSLHRESTDSLIYHYIPSTIYYIPLYTKHYIHYIPSTICGRLLLRCTIVTRLNKTSPCTRHQLSRTEWHHWYRKILNQRHNYFQYRRRRRKSEVPYHKEHVCGGKGFTWSGLHTEGWGPGFPPPSRNQKNCMVPYSKLENLYSLILMHDAVAMPHKLLPPSPKNLYETLLVV